MEERTVVVVGGGISGLTVAFELAQRAERHPFSPRILCLEATDRPGGNIRTETLNGFTCEWGPTGFLDNAPATLTLARRLMLEDRVLPARPEAERRFIYRAGRMREVPTHPLRFLGSGILSPWGKLRLLLEPLALRGPRDRDESVFAFARRRIGRPAASVLVDAMVSGIYAGDVRQLSLGATFPKMRKMEAEHGSLFRAMLAKRREARKHGASAGGPAGPGGRLTSFRGGLQVLIDALAAALGDRLRTECPVTAVSDLGMRGIRIHPREGRPIDADAVVLACPAWTAAPLVSSMDPELAAILDAIPSAPLAVAHFGYHADALGPLPEGFGFLVPRGQGPRILGTLWISNTFDGRAPERRVLMTTMIGGAHDPGVLDLDDEQILAAVRGDLETTMGIESRPYFTRLIRHPRGIPQYTLGHLDRVAAIRERLAVHPGIWVSGNSYGGISVNACIEEAPGIAEQVLEHISVRDLRAAPE